MNLHNLSWTCLLVMCACVYGWGCVCVCMLRSNASNEERIQTATFSGLMFLPICARRYCNVGVLLDPDRQKTNLNEWLHYPFSLFMCLFLLQICFLYVVISFRFFSIFSFSFSFFDFFLMLSCQGDHKRAPVKGPTRKTLFVFIPKLFLSVF